MKRFLVVLLFFGGMKAWAQDVPDFYFTSPFNLESGRDLGIPDGDKKVDATSIVLTAPTLTLLKPGPRGDLALTYRPDFTFYNAHTELNSWNHQAGMRWDYRMTTRWTFSMNDGFVSTRDNAQRFDSAFLLPRGRYDENLLYLTLSFQWRQNTTMRFRYDNSWVKFGSEHLSTPIAFNVLSNTFEYTLEQRLSSKAKLSGNYAYLRGHSLNQFDVHGLPVAPVQPSHYVGATFDYQLRPSVLVEVGGGLVHNSLTSYTFSGAAEKRFQKVLISAGFSRYLSLLGATAPGAGTAVGLGRLTPFGAVGGQFGAFGSARDLPNASHSISDTASFHVLGPVTKRFSVQVSMLASRTASLTPGGHPLQSLASGVRLEYKVTDHFGVFTDTQFFGQTSTPALPVNISRRRWFGGVQYTFSPSPEEIARRLDAIHGADTQPAPTGDAPGANAEDKQ